MTADWLERGLTPREKATLGLEIVRAYSRARWLLWRSDLPTTLTALRASPAPPLADRIQAGRTGVRLGKAIGKTLRHLPFDSRCLMRSLVLTSLLARRGIETSFVIAVKPDSELLAHAWVERDGVPLLEPAEDGFARIVEL
jgi:hypothetical protein